MADLNTNNSMMMYSHRVGGHPDRNQPIGSHLISNSHTIGSAKRNDTLLTNVDFFIGTVD